jgi:osmoprotectant transport system substrate-binding protein
VKAIARLGIVLFVIAILAACTNLPAAPAQPAAPAPAEPTAAPQQPAAGPVRIGSKDFTEELLLGEMYALVLEANGIPVERRLNLAGTQVAHEALINGEIDIYPEYTGTGYQFILGNEDGEKDPAKVYDKAAQQYKEKFNLVWLDRSPMNDTNAIACTKEAAEKYGLKTLSQLSASAPEIRFAAIPDFEERPDGLAGLKQLYGGFELKSLTVFDPGLKYKALQEGNADCAIAFSTDGQIAAFGLVLMEDDKGLWPPYNVAPVVRAQTLEQYPAVKDALDKLSALITTEEITALNWKVDGDKQEYADVAKAFLTDKGLIK